MSLDENLSSDRLHVMIQSSVWVHMINEASDHFPRSSKKARLVLALNKKMPNIQEISTTLKVPVGRNPHPLEHFFTYQVKR